MPTYASHSRPATNDANSLHDWLRKAGHQEGFDLVGVTSPDRIMEAGARLRTFLDRQYHGDMAWMAEKAEWRASPRSLWPDVRSVVMCAMNYGNGADPLQDIEKKNRGVISCYAKGKDYHVVVKKALKRLAGRLIGRAGGSVKVFADTAPVMEKPLAEAAGLGWQGKHTNLVSRELGSWFFLGAIFSDRELPSSDGEVDHCGRCRRCLDICPTDAFPAPYQLDARRCISYLTIEHRGIIPHDLRHGMGNRVFGCDDCLAICPWNKFAQIAKESRFHPRTDVDNPPISELLALTHETFAERFAGTPVKRIGRDGLVRNALIAAANSGNADYLPSIRLLMEDPSPIVRATAVWSFKQLAPKRDVVRVSAELLLGEDDERVQGEWLAD